MATDSNGLCDPYVTIMCCGQIEKSKIINNTIDPQWYQILILNILLPKPIKYAPEIHVLIKDYDKFSKDDVVGRFMIKPSDIFIPDNNDNNYDNDNDDGLPMWYKLYDADNNPIKNGEILMSFKLINVSHSKMPILPSLKPKTSDKWLQIIILGLRDLHSVFGINKSYLKFYINNKQFKTKKSNAPSRFNPNFLQILKIRIPFPDNGYLHQV